MSDQLLSLSGVSVGYGSSIVVRDIDLAIPSGSAVALLGPNGAGKTTLLKSISGVLPVAGGAVRFDGHDVSRASVHERARMGLCHVPDGNGVFPSLTVRENLVLASPPRKEKECIDLAATTFPILGQRLSQVAGTMSGGQQQMLSVVRAYIRSPKLVLIDEVSMGLAPLVVDEIFKFIATIIDGGASLLLTEQYVARALNIATHVYVLVNGRIDFSGTPEQLRKSDVMSRYMSVAADAATVSDNAQE